MAIKICSFASGSKGNCCYVSDGRTDILIDLGISATRVEKCLSVLGANPDGVTVVITHSHSDHVGGLKTFCKRHPAVRVLCQAECGALVCTAGGVQPSVRERRFDVGTLSVTALPVSHDVPCFGYIISDGDRRVAVVTDVGTLNGDQLFALGACDIVMLEANHDISKLNANPRYSSVLKARIRSNRGHLSNADCAAACAYLAENGVKNFILAHLSDENNDPFLAVREVENSVRETGELGVRVVVAPQDGMTGLFEVC